MSNITDRVDPALTALAAEFSETGAAVLKVAGDRDLLTNFDVGQLSKAAYHLRAAGAQLQSVSTKFEQGMERLKKEIGL